MHGRKFEAAISLRNPDGTSSTFKLQMYTIQMYTIQMYNKKTRTWKTIPATITLANNNTAATLNPYGDTTTLLAANKKF